MIFGFQSQERLANVQLHCVHDGRCWSRSECSCVCNAHCAYGLGVWCEKCDQCKMSLVTFCTTADENNARNKVFFLLKKQHFSSVNSRRFCTTSASSRVRPCIFIFIFIIEHRMWSTVQGDTTLRKVDVRYYLKYMRRWYR